MNNKGKGFVIKKILLVIFLLLFLSSCFGDSEEVINAKKDLGIIEDVTEKVINSGYDNTSSDLNEDPRISITQLSGNKILKLDSLKYNDFKNGNSKITGKVLGFVDKIRVDFSNENSQYPNDSFILEKFKSGGDTFTYNANSKFKVLDFGINKYTFTAFLKNNQESVLELKVLVSVNDDEYLEGKNLNKSFKKEEESSTSKLIGNEEDIIFTKLPEGGDFGNVVKLGENSFTYSDIKGFEVKKDNLKNLSCSKNEDTGNYYVTEFLGKKLNSYYYWNTCRDLVKDKGFGFYVIRLEGDKYFYEKHYIDLTHGFYGVYELETGTGINKENISEKNKEFKEKNRDFKNVEIVDNLFKKIIINK